MTMTGKNALVIEEFRANGGEVAGRAERGPLLLLHTTGAKTGEQRVNPLTYRYEDGRYIVFAAKAGAPSNPDWYHNLLANPKVLVEVGSKSFSAVARVVSRVERDKLYADQAERLTDFAVWAAQTERIIPVIEITPVIHD